MHLKVNHFDRRSILFIDIFAHVDFPDNFLSKNVLRLLKLHKFRVVTLRSR